MADDARDPGPAGQDLLDTLRLVLISGVGPHTRRTLLERFGTSAAVLAAAPSQLRGVRGIGPKLSQRIAAAAGSVDAEGEIERCRREGIAILTEADPTYPRMLREISDPPGVLFVRGTLCRRTPWPWPSSARGTPAGTGWSRPSAWRRAWAGRA